MARQAFGLEWPSGFVVVLIFYFFLAILVRGCGQWPHLDLNPDFTRKLMCFYGNPPPAKRDGVPEALGVLEPEERRTLPAEW